jgi:hypothetical protein
VPPSSALGGLARAMRGIPLWARWFGTLLAFALLIFLIHTVVRISGAFSEASPEAEINRVSEIVIAQDQAPHTAPLLPGDTARFGLQSAIAADVRNRIRREELTGPLQSVHCAPSGSPQAGRRPFGCTVRSAGISFPFLGVVDERAETLTWCKRDPPPASNAPPTAPISSACRA